MIGLLADYTGAHLATGREAIAKLIVKDRLVLAVDLSGREETFTLEVTPEQAKKLALEGQRGTLRLLMRALTDDKRNQKDQVDKEAKPR